MNIWLIAPILIPLATAIVLLLCGSRIAIQRVISVVGALALLVAGVFLLSEVWQHGVQAVQIGNWAAPFGITIVADLLSAIMILVTGFVGVSVALYALANIDGRREKFGFYAFYHFLLMGVCGAFLTGDLFNLYVWFEVMLMASFVLLALGGERAQMGGAVKYVTLNLLSSLLFLMAIGILYGKVGTLNMADLAVKLGDTGQSDLVMTSAMMLLIAFGIKAGLFPLFFWLPASYHTPPIAVSAVFAGLLTKVGVYALIRVFTLIFTQDVGYTHTIILVLSGFTMVTGVLGAAAQFEIRRILSFHIISQIGYMTMGLALLTPAALAASVFYLFHHIIVKTNLFLIGGVVEHLKGSSQLKKIGSLYRDYPLLAFLFLIPALSLGGIPPLSGFFAKFALVKAGLAIEEFAIIAVALAVGILTLYSMTKIWAEAFWKTDPSETRQTTPVIKPIPVLLLLPVVLMATATVLIGLSPHPLFEITLEAADQLLNKTAYIEAVLGK